MNEQRLIDLESKVSHQEIQIEELQQTVHAQYLLIEKIEKKLKQLTSQMDKTLPIIGHARPPHY